MFTQINNFITWFDGVVWGLPLIILILFTGILLTARLGLLQVRHLGKALKFMVKNEEGGDGEVTSFGALCTALSATIGTGNIVGVATAIAAGGPGALFWMIVAAFFGMATKYAEGLLAIKYRTIDKEGHVLGGPFYYIENGMGKQWRWLAKIFAFFGAGVGLFGIGTSACPYRLLRSRRLRESADLNRQGQRARHAGNRNDRPRKYVRGNRLLPGRPKGWRKADYRHGGLLYKRPYP